MRDWQNGRWRAAGLGEEEEEKKEMAKDSSLEEEESRPADDTRQKDIEGSDAHVDRIQDYA